MKLQLSKIIFVAILISSTSANSSLPVGLKEILEMRGCVNALSGFNPHDHLIKGTRYNTGYRDVDWDLYNFSSILPKRKFWLQTYDYLMSLPKSDGIYPFPIGTVVGEESLADWTDPLLAKFIESEIVGKVIEAANKAPWEYELAFGGIRLDNTTFETADWHSEFVPLSHGFAVLSVLGPGVRIADDFERHNKFRRDFPDRKGAIQVPERVLAISRSFKLYHAATIYDGPRMSLVFFVRRKPRSERLDFFKPIDLFSLMVIGVPTLRLPLLSEVYGP